MPSRIFGAIPNFRSNVETDACPVPNNHPEKGQPQKGQPRGVVPTMSLSDIMHRFKTLTTKKYIGGVQYNQWVRFDKKLWQRSFHDHIIRNDNDLTRIREYIKNNPLKWHLDRENPQNYGRGDYQSPESRQ